MTQPAAVSVQRLNKSYRSRGGEWSILRDADLVLNNGASVAIMGPSGSGKSTLLNIIGTLDTPDSGELTVAGVHPFHLNPRDIARFRNRTIGFVFQEHHLLPQCTVLENVLIPTLASRRGHRSHDDHERATTLLERVGLAQRAEHRPAELSGGERQRVAIARALINRPALLLADEPTGNLDRGTAGTIADLLVETCRTESIALIVVTHSDSLASRFDRTLELIDGSLQPAD